MKLLLNNQEVNIEPYYFNFSYVQANASFIGGYGGVRFTQYLEQGQVVNVSEIYEDIYNEHKNDNYEYLSEWHNVAEITAQRWGESEPQTYYLQERYHHILNEDRLIVQYRNTGTGDTFYLPVYYPRYSPYQNLITAGMVAGQSTPENSQKMVAYIGNPIYKPLVEPTEQYRGGFYYSLWDTVGTPHIAQIECDYSDLSRYPTPDTNIPLNTPDRFNLIRSTACIDTIDVLIWNGEEIVPRTPDTDTNEPKTSFGPYHDISDPVDFSSVPAVGPLDTGFIKAYVLTIAQARDLADFMLSNDFLDHVKKLFLQPIDYIISLHFLPVSPNTTTETTITIGGVDTEITAPMTYDSYITFRSGKIDLEEFWGSFLDYAPSTKVIIYIPFIGFRPLNTDDVMTGELELQYNINTVDGDFLVELHSSTSHKLNGVIATYQGNMLMSTPVTNTDYTNKIMAGFTALSQGVMAIGSGNPAMAGGALSNIVTATLMKPDFGRSGNVSGGAGMLGNFTPYLVKVRPKQAVPKLYTKLFGKPSMIGGAVSIFKGYTEFKRIDLSGIPCTESERKEIESLMKEGVFV